MTIDIISLIIGMVLWELFGAYWCFVMKPWIKKTKAKLQNNNCERVTQPKNENYKGTAMGFNGQLKSGDR